jgi:hypothetical protein
MTPEQQRIKIAEVCGLFRIMPLRRTTRKGKPDPNGVRLWYCEEHHGGAATYAEVPNYPKDLNAMHESEKTLSENDRQKYLDILADAPRNDRYLTWADSVFATAAQKAEAFLRTINLWEE